MNIKEKFESHPVIWGLSLILISSIAGFQFHEVLNKNQVNANSEIKPKIIQKIFECKIEGLEQLSEQHHSRITIMHKQLMLLEERSSKDYVYSGHHQEGAKRIREDIRKENEIYKINITNLDKKCK